MNPISRKVVGATVGAGLGGALTTIIVWLITDPQFGGYVIPDHISGAFEVILTTMITFGSGWLTTER